ncbi:MAG: MaoC family dehydratase N-terminal domain-containing protein [Actinomycetota bacterium]
MALNKALVGKEYPSVTYEAGREKIREFATAVLESGEIYHDREAAKQAGLTEQVAPPTFATILGIRSNPAAVLDPELGLNYALVVHGSQEFEYRRPIVAGDVLTATPRITEITERGANEYLTIETTITDASGEVVCVARSTLISRGTAETGG